MSIQETGNSSSISHHHLFDIGRKIDVLSYAVSRVFSCWHLQLSRPFTHEQETYRSCLRCGMRRSFDLENWKARGRFYSMPVESLSVERRSKR
jgi:hypothetical protein